MGLKYAKGILSKKTVKELVRIAVDEEGRDEEAVTTMTKPELIDDLLTIEESEDELDDELEDEEEDDLELPDEEEVDELPDEPVAKKTTTKAKQTKYTEGGKAPNGDALLGAKEVATQIGTDAKSLRQFFRSGKSSFEAVGAGGRYEFAAGDVAKIKTEFDAWKANKPGRGRGASEGGTTRSRGKRGAAKEVEVIEEVEEIEELEDLEELDEDDLELED